MKFFIVLFYLLSTLPAQATLNNVDKTQIYNKNLLTNGGFENGKAQWTPNDTADFTTSTTTPLEGSVNAEWDADASTDTLISTAVTIPSGWYGRNGVASCLFVTPSGTATHEIQAYDGSNVLSETTITSSTSPTRTSTNFIFPSSGSVSLRIYANADEPNLEVDSCFLGPAEGYNVGSVSQATLIGHAYYASTTNCTGWARTNTAMGDFSSDTDCPAPTVVSNVGPGTISTTDNNLPQITVTNLPPGRYEVRSVAGLSASASAFYRMAITDGTTTSAASGFNPSTTTNEAVSISGIFTYTAAQSSVTFKLQVMSSSGTATITNDYYETQFYIYRFPTSQETSYTADKLANSWSGYFDNTCSFARTNTAYGDATDASCNLTERTNNNFGTVTSNAGTNIGINFTPSRAGRYWVCATVSVAGSALGADLGLKFWDGTTTIVERDLDQPVAATVATVPLCGLYVASNTSAKTLSIQTKSLASGSITIAALVGTSAVEWSIFQIDQAFPAPNLVNSVVSSYNGTIRTEYVAFGGATEGTNNCAATPCTIYRQSGGISSVSRSGTGAYTLNFTAGVFSAAPTCTGSVTSHGVAVAFANVSGAPTSTTFPFTTYDAGTPTIRDATGYFICIGPK